MIFSKFSHLACAFTFWGISSLAGATVVQMQTAYGEIEVNLFDDTTPATVLNFLEYVNDGSYDNSLVHRSIGNFITQGGGYYLDEALTRSSVTKKTPVINEPIYSNVRGTIAMAKLGCQPNSATSEWFINLADNSGNLDTQNSGFTVFGQLTENSLAVLDAIAALPTYNLGSPLSSTPLSGISQDDSEALTLDNFVFIEAMTVVDPNLNSAEDLIPAQNTLIANSNNSDCESNDDSGGSLNASWLFLSLCLLIGRGRRKL
jgi:cyclophilin family peptidyl-prolyl cis-trans isomerase